MFYVNMRSGDMFCGYRRSGDMFLWVQRVYVREMLHGCIWIEDIIHIYFVLYPRNMFSQARFCGNMSSYPR